MAGPGETDEPAVDSLLKSISIYISSLIRQARRTGGHSRDGNGKGNPPGASRDSEAKGAGVGVASAMSGTSEERDGGRLRPSGGS